MGLETLICFESDLKQIMILLSNPRNAVYFLDFYIGFVSGLVVALMVTLDRQKIFIKINLSPLLQTPVGSKSEEVVHSTFSFLKWKAKRF